MLGVLAKETAVLLVPAYWACHWRRGGSAFGKTVVLGAGCTLAFLAARCPLGWRPGATLNGVEGRRPEGPDVDWIHLPDPIADAIAGLASRIGALERALVDVAGEEQIETSAEVRPLRPAGGPNPAGG